MIETQDWSTNKIFSLADVTKCDDKNTKYKNLFRTLDLPYQSVSSLEDGELHPELLKVVLSSPYREPTALQSFCLPFLLSSKDTAVFLPESGNEHIAAFLLTALQKTFNKKNDRASSISSLIVTLSNDDVVKIKKIADELKGTLEIKISAITAGENDDQSFLAELKNSSLVILSAKDFVTGYKKRWFNINEIDIIIVDQLDKIIANEFSDDIRDIFRNIPANIQKIISSQAFAAEVKAFITVFLKKPEMIRFDLATIQKQNIAQYSVICDTTNKLKVLFGLLTDHSPKRALVFVNRKMTAEWLHYKLHHNGFQAEVIYGFMPLNQKVQLLKKIKDDNVKIIVLTDAVHQNLYLTDVSHIYNFDLPEQPSNYIHRLDHLRSASGAVYSLACEEFSHNLLEIERLVGPDFSLKAHWFDQKYLEIKDTAGSPQLERARRSQERGERPGRPERPEGRLTMRKPSDAKHKKRDRADHRSSPETSPRQQEYDKQPKKPLEKNQITKAKHHGKESRKFDRERFRKHHHKDQERKFDPPPHKRPDGQKQHGFRQASKSSTETPLSKSETLGGIIKKIASVFWKKTN